MGPLILTFIFILKNSVLNSHPRKWIVRGKTNHTIMVDHNELTGRAVLFVDENEIFQRGKQLFNSGFEHQFTVDKKYCIFRIKPKWKLSHQFEYFLLVNGKPQRLENTPT